MARILRPGDRGVLTCCEAVDRDDPAVTERLRRVPARAVESSVSHLDESGESYPTTLLSRVGR